MNCTIESVCFSKQPRLLHTCPSWSLALSHLGDGEAYSLTPLGEIAAVTQGQTSRGGLTYEPLASVPIAAAKSGNWECEQDIKTHMREGRLCSEATNFIILSSKQRSEYSLVLQKNES